MSKKFFTTGISALMSLLLFPNISLSGDTSNYTNSGLYISGQYRPAVSHFSKFSVRETHRDIAQLVGLKNDVDSVAIGSNTGISKKDNFNFPYVAEFQDNAVSFSGAIGYSHPEGPRLELEASYEKFDVKNPGNCTTKDAYRYFALARSISTATPKTPDDKKYTVMKNDGLSVTSVMINGCYDFSLDSLPVLPYACASIGGDFIEFFDALHVKFAYQGKLGITYPLSSRVNLFASGYYHKVIGDQFKNLHVQHVVELSEDPKTTSAVATLNVVYLGGEVGARFIF